MKGFCANLCFDLLQNYALRDKIAVEDFLQIKPLIQFDAVLSNPPFKKGVKTQGKRSKP
jgi:16S rRNA G1207 methylase RsmC